ncbi:MAG TPA: 3-hydroxyacyl-CoA dehydrogenase NAD-binding domain-containing protein, partial [Acidobacteriaceae bacterium]|nr:3-hydroxyacyl-CoA dehydrogenase NAD-binding domain-containing protein [Acidobacteriaceae bacterium]
CGEGDADGKLRVAIRTVAVIGAGRVGRGFALACAAAGFDVVLEDVMPANLRRAQEEYADLAAQNTGARGRLAVAATIEDAVREADVAVDFVPDELESKLEIFCMVDRMAPPKTILLTPSEAQSITDLASCTYRAERCFAMRGGLGFAKPVRLLHPAGAAQAELSAVGDFLRALGYDVRVEVDADMPNLMKNLN